MKLAVVLTLVACGRYRFDPREADAMPDVASACAHTFCDDFDRSGPLESGWDAIQSSSGATLVIDTRAASTPGAFLLSLPAPSLENGFLVKHFAQTTTSARIELALSYDSANPAAAEIDLIQLQWDALPATCTSFGYFLVRDGTGPFDLQETYGGCGGNEDTPILELANLGYRTIVMEITFGDIGTAAVRVDLDGVTKIQKATSHAIARSPLTLRMGGGAVRNMSAPWQIRYDDVRVDLQ